MDDRHAHARRGQDHPEFGSCRRVIVKTLAVTGSATSVESANPVISAPEMHHRQVRWAIVAEGEVGAHPILHTIGTDRYRSDTDRPSVPHNTWRAAAGALRARAACWRVLRPETTPRASTMRSVGERGRQGRNRCRR